MSGLISTHVIGNNLESRDFESGRNASVIKPLLKKIVIKVSVKKK